MKGFQIKIFVFLLTLIVPVNLLFAQGVEENAAVRNYLNNMFSTLDKTKFQISLQLLTTAYFFKIKFSTESFL